MHDIIFRGQRVDNKKWVYGYYYAKRDKLDASYMRCYIRFYDPDDEFNIAREVIPETVGQHVFMPDITGIDLYVGDRIIDAYDKLDDLRFRLIIYRDNND